MKKPALIIMAAGMGSRYGGLKQIDPIGPNGEIIIDYSIYDAIKAGFGKIVFVIKKEIEAVFKEAIGNRIEKFIDVSYVFQDINDIPHGFKIPEERVKPWGTGHAVLSCRNEVKTSFAVINADDFYGTSSYKVLYDFLSENYSSGLDNRYAMVGYKLENTINSNGYVSRGICAIDDSGYLKSIKERTRIEKFGNSAKYTEDGECWVTIPEGSIVSMNMWGFSESIFNALEELFIYFLTKNSSNLQNSEFFLPEVVDSLISDGNASVKVLDTKERWYGVTYKEDKNLVREAIINMIKQGKYPERLWG
ncbi:MAG: sugar phosphate nucleotidyltransferase [Clostridia bacterium]|nr:sugar phosphate nucleotidyltransferase [Clostridia bacterium]